MTLNDMSENTKFRFRERHFVCGVPNCHQKFVSASSVVRHIARVHQRDDSCNDKARSEKEKHAGTFMCEYCSKTFDQHGKLTVHLKVHESSSAKGFSCNEGKCQKMFFSSEGLRRHKLTHLGIKLYKCDICDVRCSSNVALKEHCARHTDLRQYSCDICGRSFRQISCFQRHLQMHSGERRYQCLVCLSKFSQAAYLKSHMKKHTGESPYKCSVCQKRFKHASDVKRHMSVHSDEKRFACSICPARFKDYSSCCRHVREHTTGKTHVCSICSMPFKRATRLKNHLQKQHGTEAAANPVLLAPADRDGIGETLHYPSSATDLAKSNCADELYYSRCLAEVFDTGRQLESCDVIDVQDDSPGRHCGTLAAISHGSDTTNATNSDADNRNDEISDLLFSQERTDLLPLPIPSLDENSITDIVTTSNTANVSVLRD